MRTVVTFRSSVFNTSESQPNFINPGCFGDDLARWLIGRLRSAGVPADQDPGQEDFGWYFEFEVPEGRHCCVLSFRPGDDAADSDWVAWVERSRGFLGSLVGLRRRSIAPSALRVLHDILSNAPEVSSVRWHKQREFESGREDAADSAP